MRSRIQASLSIKHNALVIGAVLAHELAHHYLKVAHTPPLQYFTRWFV
ncbi:MAG: hypothetical protein ACE149_04430 [Armatimonadota bacterium]